jgi:NADH:ubiquinone oxidoreductase subunit 4 (subunit M)
VHFPEYLAWAPMLVLIVALGVLPNLIFRQTNGPVSHNITAAFTQTNQVPGAPVQAAGTP